MRRIVSIPVPSVFILGAISALCLASAMPAVAHAALGPNLINNASLESGTGEPTGWEAVNSETSNIVIQTYPVAGYEGARAARISATTYTGGDVFWLPPNTPVLAGKQYVFTGYSKANTQSLVIAAFLNAAGDIVSFETLGVVASSTLWKAFTATTTIPTGITQIRIQHVLQTVGQLDVDAYSLREVVLATTTPPASPSQNLIKNGAFEATQTNINAPKNWSSNYWGSLTPVFSYGSFGISGSKGVETRVINYVSGDAKWYSDQVLVNSQSIYKYNAQYQSDVPTSVNVEYQLEDGSYLYKWVDQRPASSAWTNYTVYITVPEGAKKLSVLHGLSSNGFLRLDNVSLVSMPYSPFPKGIVTLAFDDGLSSQYAHALPILNAVGMKATFFIISQEPGTSEYYMTWPQVQSLATQGHEVAAHTRTHADLNTLSVAEVNAEIVGSRTDLVAKGITPKTFAYPYGSVSPSISSTVRTAGFTAARSSYWGLNTPLSKRHELADVRIERTTKLEEVKALVEQAARDKRWLVLELHDVLPSVGDEYSTTNAFFQELVTYLKTSAVDVVTLQQGAQLLK